MEENKEEKIVNEGKNEEGKVKEVKEKSEETLINEKVQENDKAADSTTFKKSEMKNNPEKSKKSSHKVIKAILVIIILLIVAYFIFFCRNLIILKNLKELANQYKDVTNYSYETLTGSETHLTCRRKDDVIRVELEHEQDPSTDIIIWQDKNTNEQILAFPGHNSATRSSGTMMGVVCRMPFSLTDLGDTVDGFALYSLIYTDTVDDKECYVIQVAPNFKMWIEKDTGLLYKQQSGDDYVEVLNVELNTVDAVYMPDLTGYEITYSQDNIDE